MLKRRGEKISKNVHSIQKISTFFFLCVRCSGKRKKKKRKNEKKTKPKRDDDDDDDIIIYNTGHCRIIGVRGRELYTRKKKKRRKKSTRSERWGKLKESFGLRASTQSLLHTTTTTIQTTKSWKKEKPLDPGYRELLLLLMMMIGRDEGR